MLYMSFDAYQQDDQRSNPKRRDTSKYMSKSKACAGAQITQISDRGNLSFGVM